MQTLSRRSTRKFEYAQYKDFLKEWEYEWILTLTYPDKWRIGQDKIHHDVLNLLRDLGKEEGIQVCGWYSISYLCHHPHVHLLLIGRSRNGKTLQDVTRRTWQDRWPHISRIDNVRSSSDVAKYLATHKLRFKSDWAEIYDYNLKLLKALRKPSSPPTTSTPPISLRTGSDLPPVSRTHSASACRHYA